MQAIWWEVFLLGEVPPWSSVDGQNAEKALPSFMTWAFVNFSRIRERISPWLVPIFNTTAKKCRQQLTNFSQAANRIISFIKVIGNVDPCAMILIASGICLVTKPDRFLLYFESRRLNKRIKCLHNPVRPRKYWTAVIRHPFGVTSSRFRFKNEIQKI